MTDKVPEKVINKVETTPSDMDLSCLHPTAVTVTVTLLSDEVSGASGEDGRGSGSVNSHTLTHTVTPLTDVNV